MLNILDLASKLHPNWRYFDFDEIIGGKSGPDGQSKSKWNKQKMANNWMVSILKHNTAMFNLKY